MSLYFWEVSKLQPWWRGTCSYFVLYLINLTIVNVMWLGWSVNIKKLIICHFQYLLLFCPWDVKLSSFIARLMTTSHSKFHVCLVCVLDGCWVLGWYCALINWSWDIFINIGWYGNRRFCNLWCHDAIKKRGKLLMNYSTPLCTSN